MFMLSLELCTLNRDLWRCVPVRTSSMTVVNEQRFSYLENFNNFGPFTKLKKGRSNFNWCSHLIDKNNFNSTVGLVLVSRMSVVISAS